MIAKIIIISLTIAISLAATDYCSLCENHIACNHNGNWSSSCPADAEISLLSLDTKNTILAEHNFLRNKVASGSQSGFKSASKMSKLVSFSTIFKLRYESKPYTGLE